MSRLTATAISGVLLLLILSCSSDGGNPVEPESDPGLTSPSARAGQAQTHLWGYWDVTIDVENQTVEAVPNRDAVFAANVVTFLNGNPMALRFNIHNVIYAPDYVEIDIDVGITHPFPGMPQYNGYDVRGIFVADNSESMEYGSMLSYPVLGTDQYLLNADGYTRWYNMLEYYVKGLFGYTPGDLATKDYGPNSTLNPYRYYADGLGANTDVWEFLTSTSGNGVFRSGSTNTRNYLIRFPNWKGVKYGYSVVANWEDESTHPANAPEAVACDVVDNSNVYYVDATTNGGNLVLDISLFGWDYQASKIFIESTVLGSVYELTSGEMTPVDSGDHYATYHVEIPADNVTGLNGNEFWVIAEIDGFNYHNDFGYPNQTGNDTLAAFFRNDLTVYDEIPINYPPVVESGVDGEDKPDEGSSEIYTVNASDPEGDTLSFNWTVTDSDTGDPVPGFDGVPGDGDGNLTVDFGAIGAEALDEFDIDCDVSDGNNPPVAADTLSVQVIPLGDLYVSNHVDFSSLPEYGTKANPYHTISAALASGYSDGDVILVDKGSGPYTETVTLTWPALAVTLWGYGWYVEGRPVIECSTTTAIQIYRYYCTIRGFKVQYADGASNYNLVFVGDGAHFTTITDCYFTGISSYCSPVAIYVYGNADNFAFTNNMVSGFGTSCPTGDTVPHALHNTGGSTAHDISRNIFNEIVMPDDRSIYSVIVFLNRPAAGTKLNNNLITHIDYPPQSSHRKDICVLWVNYPTPITEIAHNTIDNISLQNSTYPYSDAYGIRVGGNSPPAYEIEIHSNIITSFYKYASTQYTYGVYCYNTVTDYCDIWNFPMGGRRLHPNYPGPNTIEADPLYVNNTTEPYDYHLQDGSPCIGTGKNGEDMGCYGGLEEGQVVGLLTPE